MKTFFENTSNAIITKEKNLTQETKRIESAKLLSNTTHSDYFTNLINEGKFIDKSMLIDVILSDHAFVKTFIYPNHCGKSVNLSMLHTFFSKLTDKNKQEIFSRLKISKSTNSIKYMGQYSVIYLNLDESKPKNYNELVKLLSIKIAILYREHSYLIDTLDDDYKDDYNMFSDADQKPISKADLERSLWLLTLLITDFNRTNQCCKDYENPIVLIDGYDRLTTFLEHDKQKGERLVSILLSKALKGNDYLCYAMMMASTRNCNVMPNNSRFYSVNYSSYSKYFGLDEQEAKLLLEKYNLAAQYSELKADFHYCDNRPAFNPDTIFNYIEMNVDKNTLSI